MPLTVSPLPLRRSDLRIEPYGAGREHVVKDPRTGTFFLLGEQEHFLLLQLDGRCDSDAVRAEFERRFREPLAEADLETFVEAARGQGILAGTTPPPPPRQSILYWRKRFFDPDALFTRLEPRIRFLWTRGFLLFSGAAILLGALVLWANREDFARSLRDALRWESVVLGWFLVFGVGMLHECAHGLTCKHHGGEVREVGFLFMYFMPCFYCNVSDAWLFREKRKRLWVMLAGGYCDLVVWALAIFAWRVTEPGTFLHRASFLVLGLSGIDSLFNFNPLIKLDGYYLLSDWQEVPNLRQRALDRLKSHARRLLWGGPRPEPEDRGRFLTGFGLLSWVFTTTFLSLSLVFVAEWLHGSLGAMGYVAAAALTLPAIVATFGGFAAGEVWEMVKKRRFRTLLWLLILGGGGAALCLVEVDEYSGGTFTVRPTVREEIRAPVEGFLRTVLVEEGDAVSEGDGIARLEVADLHCRLDQKQAETREAEAQLRLLQSGTRPEEIEEQRGRVRRAERWLEQAQKDLERLRKTLAEELAALDERIAEAELQRDYADSDFSRIDALFAKSVASREEMERADQARQVARARVSQAGAERRAREIRGTILPEEEVVRREKDLGDERARLALLEAGTRPEEIVAQKARLDRLVVETRHLEGLRAKLDVRAGVAGTVVTPRLREKVGTFLEEGDLICVVEGKSCQVAEVALEEEKLRSIEPGQAVRFKARALPFQTIEGRVTGIAPSAAKPEAHLQGTVVVRCSFDCALPVVRSSMSGYARIYTGRRPVGGILLDRCMRLFRTEFWW